MNNRKLNIKSYRAIDGIKNDETEILQRPLPKPDREPEKPKKNARKRRKMKSTIALILVSAVILMAISTFVCIEIADSETQKAKAGIDELGGALKNKDIGKLGTKLDEANGHLKRARIAINIPFWLRLIPVIGNDYKIAQYSVNAAAIFLDPVSELLEEANDSLKKMEIEDPSSLKFSKMTNDERRSLIEMLDELQPEAKATIKAHGKAQRITDKIKDEKAARFDQINDPKEKIVGYIEEFGPTIEALGIATEIIPAIAGYPEEQEYLFLFENNMELRASGGFIGAVGSVAVENGTMKNLKIGDSYKLDNREANYGEAPDWYKKYNAANEWFIRDSSIASSDFPTTARRALETYSIIRNEDPFEGVIAITPTFIEELIGITGPIELKNYPYIFTSENTALLIEEHVQFRYQDLGIPESERKDMLSNLSAALLSKLFATKSEDLGDALRAVNKAFDEKQIMIYMVNPKKEMVVKEWGWGGAVDTHEGINYFSQVDNNVAALKTDIMVDRRADLEISEDASGRLKVKAMISYTNKSPSFTKLLTRYRTYGWLLVPLGSELLSFEGADSTDKIEGDNNGEVRMVEEASLNKTRLEFFKSIEPSEEESITIEYLLPKDVKKKDLQTLIQKQPGVTGASVGLKFDFELEDYATNLSEKEENQFESELDTDKYFNLE